MARIRANNEGTIYQRTDGRWVACVTTFKDGKRKRVSVYAESEDEARKKLTEMKGKQDNHLQVKFERNTVGEWLETWLETFIQPIRKPRTWAGYDMTIRKYVLPAIGRESLVNVDPTKIQQILNHWYAKEGKQRTAEYIRAVLRSAFNRAVRLKLMPDNPIAALDAIKVSRQITGVFTPVQAETFLAAAANHRLEALFWLAITLGLRKGELIGLRLEDIDLRAQELHVRKILQWVKLPGSDKRQLIEGDPKSEESKRDLPIPDCTANAIRRHLARRDEERCLAGAAWQESGRVFTTTIGTPIDGDNLGKIFQELCRVAGVPKIRVHDLRHSCGSFLHAKGVSAFTIQQILGHSQLATTRRYTHIDQGVQRQAVNSLGELLQKDVKQNTTAESLAVNVAVKSKIFRIK